MENLQKENKTKIFEAIQNLKDSIFGLKQPYTHCCYDNDAKKGYMLNMTKMNSFVKEMTEIAKETGEYSEEIAPMIPAFFEVCVRFLLAACNPSDWLFISFKKISNTLYKCVPDEKSTFDIMVEEARHYIDEFFPAGEFEPAYKIISTQINDTNFEGFTLCVKHTIETYIDRHELNSINSELLTEQIVSRIQSASNKIQFDMRRIGRMESVKNYEGQ